MDDVEIKPRWKNVRGLDCEASSISLDNVKDGMPPMWCDHEKPYKMQTPDLQVCAQMLWAHLSEGVAKQNRGTRIVQHEANTERGDCGGLHYG